MKMKKIVLDGIIVILFLILIIAAYFLFIKKDVYYNVKKEMVEKAKEHVLKNNVQVTNQEYIFLDDLHVDNAELCLQSSGVIVTKIGEKLEYTPYLKCLDYESKIIDNDNTYIELNGDTVVLAKKGTLYLDSGFKKNKDVVVTTIGEVSDEVGAYTINYVVKEKDVQKDILKRIVIVSDYDNGLIEIDDKEKPIITLNGEENMLLALNEKFVEPGYIAYDSKDGNLTSKVKVESDKIDNKKIGDYKIKYSVSNSRGESASVTRTVKVVEKKSNLKIITSTKEEDKAITIEFKVSGSGFKKLILPDEKTSDYTINYYKVTENGEYTFTVIDEYDNKIYKTIVINNFDSESPTGECVATRGENVYTIKVNANDNVGIKGVIYIVNGIELGLFNSLEYKTIEVVEKAEAIIVDLIGNKTRTSCKIND